MGLRRWPEWLIWRLTLAPKRKIWLTSMLFSEFIRFMSVKGYLRSWNNLRWNTAKICKELEAHRMLTTQDYPTSEKIWETWCLILMLQMTKIIQYESIWELLSFWLCCCPFLKSFRLSLMVRFFWSNCYFMSSLFSRICSSRYKEFIWSFLWPSSLHKSLELFSLNCPLKWPLVSWDFLLFSFILLGI